jgi:oxalate---CoA ligase
VTPLHPSASPSPWVVCASNGPYPTAFDPAPVEGWSPQNASSAPVYWKVNTTVPLHLWALSDAEPPFWQDVRVETEEDAIVYWDSLKKVSLNAETAKAVVRPSDSDSVTGPLRPTAIGVKCLRRSVSWKEGYILTWHQERYIRRFVNPRLTSGSEENLENEGIDIQHIANIVSAPQEVVGSFIEKIRKQQLAELEKARARVENSKQAKRARKAGADRALIAQRAAEDKEHRKREWENLISRTYSGTVDESLAKRLDRVRVQFLQSATTTSQPGKWEKLIEDAVKEADIARNSLLPPSGHRMQTTALPHGIHAGSVSNKTYLASTTLSTSNTRTIQPPPIAPVLPEKPVRELIEAMGPAILHEPKKRSNKKATSDGEN